MIPRTYPVNETFLSLQGEGLFAGTLNVFVRFAGCNLTCSRDGEAGFDCDTEFVSSVPHTATDIIERVRALWPNVVNAPRVILTGGEPLLHVDGDLVTALLAAHFMVAIETNGTRPLPAEHVDSLLYVACSPKSAEHTLQVQRVDELRYVRNAGQGIPKPSLAASSLFLSPAWSDDPAARDANLRHCINLIRANPQWRLSEQRHKAWNIR